MKIIKEGKLPSEKIMRGICNNCHTEIECKGEEAKYHYEQREGCYYSIKCPLEGCTSVIWLVLV